MEIQNLTKLTNALRQRAAKARQDSNVAVLVGFTASYAIFVHEDLTAAHKPGKQAKFLEAPARLFRNDLKGIVFQAMRAGKTMAQALLLAGLRLQREAQLITPVDTGNLRAGAFARLET